MNHEAIEIEKAIFEVDSESHFEELALRIFRYQAIHNEPYRTFLSRMARPLHEINKLERIPFLPISMFKKHKIVSVTRAEFPVIFESSGTTSSTSSKHYVRNPKLYERSIEEGFQQHFGGGKKIIMALLPGYLDRNNSSLVYMVNHLMKKNPNKLNGFYLDKYQNLRDTILEACKGTEEVILFGVTHALLRFGKEIQTLPAKFTIIETGGMKGGEKELVRNQLYEKLHHYFPNATICSEYGMTELLSQSYSKNDGLFRTAISKKVYIREASDPLSFAEYGRTGGINIIDLCNLHSCSFIASDDLGKMYKSGEFEVLGRFDNSDIRGCNLMAF